MNAEYRHPEGAINCAKNVENAQNVNEVGVLGDLVLKRCQQARLAIPPIFISRYGTPKPTPGNNPPSLPRFNEYYVSYLPGADQTTPTAILIKSSLVTHYQLRGPANSWNRSRVTLDVVSSAWYSMTVGHALVNGRQFPGPVVYYQDRKIAEGEDVEKQPFAINAIDFMACAGNPDYRAELDVPTEVQDFLADFQANLIVPESVGPALSRTWAL